MPGKSDIDRDSQAVPITSTKREVSEGSTRDSSSVARSQNSRRRREERKTSKLQQDPPESRARTLSAKEDGSFAAEETPGFRKVRASSGTEDSYRDEDLERPGAVRVAGPEADPTAETPTIVHDDDTMVSAPGDEVPPTLQQPDEHTFSDLSTLSPNTTALPIAAELVLDELREGGQNVQDIVAEVLRQQQKQQQEQQGAGGTATSATTSPTIPSGNAPPESSPTITEAVVVDHKRVCGGRLSRTMLLVGIVIAVLSVGLAVAMAVIFSGDSGDKALVPTPTLQPSAGNSSPSLAPVPHAPTTPSQLTWQETIQGKDANDEFGYYTELSGDGNTLAVGAPGNNYVRVYRNSPDSSAWKRIGQTLSGSGGTFGYRLDINQDGNRLVIGVPRDGTYDRNAGLVKVYEYNGSDQWTQRGEDLFGDEAGDFFGWDVAISDDGNIIACTAREADAFNSTNTGLVRMYKYDGAEYQPYGQTLEGEADNDQFGRSVGMAKNGQRVAIGAVRGGDSLGRIYVYDHDGIMWNLVGQALDGDAFEDFQGTSVDISSETGNYLAIGASGHDGIGSGSGMVKVYELEGSSWVQYGSFFLGETEGDFLGSSQVSISGDGQLVAIGAHKHGDFDRGKAYLYAYTDGDWTLVDSIIGDDSEDNIGFAINVADDGSRFVAGAKGASPGYVKVFNVE